MDVRSGGRWAVVMVAALVLASSCSGGGDEPATTTTSSSTTLATETSVAVTTSTDAPYTGPVGALTGAPIADDRVGAPAIVLKIGNNDGKSRPQTGLVEADIVFEELVEGLKTRFLAVFQSTLPDFVGPIRSGRSSDVDLMVGLSTPMFGYSGGNTTVLRQLRDARDAGVFVDVGFLRTEDPYFRSTEREAPDNLYAILADLPADGAGSPSPLFTYGDFAGSTGTDVGGVHVRYPSTFGRESTHLWDPSLGGWVRIQDGTLQTSDVAGDEVEVAPANVVVAQVFYDLSEADAASPQATSFGSGPVQVFTRGRMIEGTWERSSENPEWKVLDGSGAVIPLAPGSTWVLLAAGEGSRFATAEIEVLDSADAAELLSDVRKTATP